MKIYIFSDLEGISGICNAKYISSDLGRPDLVAIGRKYMAEDVNACIEGCFRAGADEVIVRDGHGGSSNLTREMVDPRADLIEGQVPRDSRFPELEGSDGVILLGYHGMAGTKNAVLEHTFNSKAVQNVWLNGRTIGEIGIDASIAGEHGIPVILVTGDDKACLEASDWIPGVITCAVKKGLSCMGARMPGLATTHTMITEKTVEAIAQLNHISPLASAKPAVFRVELMERGQLPSGVSVIDGRTYEVQSDSVEQAWIDSRI